MLDSFKAHTADSVSEELEKVKSDIAVIPGGCTSKIQPLDVCINRPFKDSLRKSWVDYMYAHAPSGATLATIPKPSKQQVVDWVVAAWRDLQQRPELVKNSFKVCGISNALDGSEEGMVRYGEYISGSGFRS